MVINSKSNHSEQINKDKSPGNRDRVYLVDVYAWTLESLVFQFSLCLLERFTSCYFQFIVSVLSPTISHSVFCLCLECIVSSLIRNVPYLLCVYSWKKFLWSTVVVILLVVWFCNCLVLEFSCLSFLCFNFRFNFLDLGWLFAGFDGLLFFCLFLWSCWFFSFFILQVKLFLRVKVGGVDWAFFFRDFFIFFYWFFIFFGLRSLRFGLFFRGCLFFSFLFGFLSFFGNDDFSFFRNLDFIVIQVFEPFGLWKLTDHPASRLLVNGSIDFWRFRFG